MNLRTPLGYFRFFALFCALIFLFFMSSTILSQNTNALVLFQNNFSYLIFGNFVSMSLIPSTVAIINFLRLQQPLKSASPNERVKKIRRYFLLQWIIGLLLLPVIVTGVSLGHLDCNQNCIPEIMAADPAANLFLFVWLIVPFGLWILTGTQKSTTSK